MRDIKHSENGDILLYGGDIAYTESTQQHQCDILHADKGHFKEYPAVGVGIINYIHDVDPENFLRTVRKEFVKDGMMVYEININSNELIIDAVYADSNNKAKSNDL